MTVETGWLQPSQLHRILTRKKSLTMIPQQQQNTIQGKPLMQGNPCVLQWIFNLYETEYIW